MKKKIQIELIYKSIVALLGATMLLSCENSIKEVESITAEETRPEIYGENVEFTFTDSTRIQYKAYAIEFLEIKTEEEVYKEFPKGGNVISYNEDGSQAWNIKSNYAKFMDDEQLWELRNDVVAVSDDGKTINSELMYWDQKKQTIYSDQYVRITEEDGQMIEGDSFTADDKLNQILLSRVSGEVFLEDKNLKK
ncbi:LPS export ABC transporter periplasmic protein LptC [Ancylomarina euxinus]|uniref:LPS export ABC transporter periplasmic protein LptC n=1 Tax=Ancylomarina euxinus TaxID=2283627 RepID=A0A425Y1A7_9BACT|nr:LPS export ABC transporter periplasmic protein LptC [Ancylomarina euxinus]MCZ4693864.1 LPS export ABC transporter periplasmic protein LptC [Ancylomarina euxinus]MUP15057.1 LPS export ABC transporter periplasmic protein LptC [Ancylomarina euxinus]RRG21480.1 LPS export ABC transporter periplasmic protein LptC [Ancylomarina euxinus]